MTSGVRRQASGVAILIALAACSTPAPVAPAVAPAVAKHSLDVPLSDPAEYQLERVSADAGEAIFARTGIGDPYRTGIPYPMFLALLRAFPETFGADTQALADRFGFVARAPDPASDDADLRAGLPVGMHLTIDPYTGVRFVVTSCALCHAAKIGDTLVVGLANRRVRIHAYDRAFAQITTRRGFSVEHLARLASEEATRRQLIWPENMRDALAGATVDNLVQRASDRAELHTRTAADPPGRVATLDFFVGPLHQLTGRDVAFSHDVGWAKIPDVIGFAQRTTLSWDAGGEGSMDLLAVEADVAAGVRVAWMERHPLQGASLGAYLRQPAPRPAFPGRIDRERAARGHKLFVEDCAPCHGRYEAGRVDYKEQVVKLGDLGTDPARANAASDSFVAAANDPQLTRGYTRFRKTDGYVPPVLTNVWARAPYGHAGQWPSLAVMATPPERRPHKFVVAYDAPYDLDAVGLSTAPHGAGDYAYDGDRPGLSVLGHPFLADLGNDAKDVIEYLKTL